MTGYILRKGPSIGVHDRWQIFEMDINGGNVKQITPTDLPDVDFFDSCYLPDGRVAVTSTASYQGLPCENGKRPMARSGSKSSPLTAA